MIQIVLKNINSIESLPLERPDWMEEKRWNSIQKSKSEADKKRSFASACLLDFMCRDLEIDNPIYEYTEKGKPFLNGWEYAFNLSHSGDYAVLAYHQSNEPLGVDIQKVRPMREGMEKRILHEKENVPVENEERLRCLNRLWAVKESFVKMTGEGLARDFRTIHVDFENGTVWIEEDRKAEFSAWEWKEEYYIAMCSVSREECEIKEI